MILTIIAAVLFGSWLLLVLLGKGGFVHILLLTGIGIAAVEIMYRYRVCLKSPD